MFQASKRQIARLAGVTMRMRTMTRFHSLSIVTIGAALSMTAGLALAGENTVSADQILNALKPKPATRGLSTGAQGDPAATAQAASFVETLRHRKTPTPSPRDPQ